MMRFLFFILSLVLANLMVGSDSELIKAAGMFYIIFIFSMHQLTETIAEKRND